MSKMSRAEFDNLDIDREQQEQEMQRVAEYEVNPFDATVMKQNAIPVIQDNLNYLLWSVESGNSNALEVFAVVKTIEKMFTDLKTKIDTYAISEAETFNKSSFEAHGCKFEMRNGGKMFDYKEIKEWQEANENLKSIEAKYKLAYESKEKNMLAVSEDGEILELPKVTFRKNSLIVKIK